MVSVIGDCAVCLFAANLMEGQRNPLEPIRLWGTTHIQQNT